MQIYVTDLICSVSRAHHAVKAFHRSSLMPGETRTTTLTLALKASRFTGEYYQPIKPGDFEISVGTSSQHTETIILMLP